MCVSWTITVFCLLVLFRHTRLQHHLFLKPSLPVYINTTSYHPNIMNLPNNLWMISRIQDVDQLINFSINKVRVVPLSIYKICLLCKNQFNYLSTHYFSTHVSCHAIAQSLFLLATGNSVIRLIVHHDTHVCYHIIE